MSKGNIAALEIEDDRIAAAIDGWSGEDIADLLPAVQQLETLIKRWKQESDFSDIDECELRAYHALTNAGTRDDNPWPSPWDEFACEFAFVVDRKGNFLAREFGDQGAWEIHDWVEGINCKFTNADAGPEDIGQEAAGSTSAA